MSFLSNSRFRSSNPARRSIHHRSRRSQREHSWSLAAETSLRTGRECAFLLLGAAFTLILLNVLLTAIPFLIVPVMFILTTGSLLLILTK